MWDQITNEMLSQDELDLAKIKLNASISLSSQTTEEIINRKVQLIGLDMNPKMDEEIIKRIFLTDDNQVDLITNSTVTKNYLVLIIKTDYKDLNPKSNEYEQYEAKARLNLTNKIYLSHDRNLNSKYKVELNQRTIERVKNSF